jgi:hypothetical protein
LSLFGRDSLTDWFLSQILETARVAVTYAASWGFLNSGGPGESGQWSDDCCGRMDLFKCQRALRAARRRQYAKSESNLSNHPGSPTFPSAKCPAHYHADNVFIELMHYVHHGVHACIRFAFNFFKLQ